MPYRVTVFTTGTFHSMLCLGPYRLRISSQACLIRRPCLTSALYNVLAFLIFFFNIGDKSQDELYDLLQIFKNGRSTGSDEYLMTFLFLIAQGMLPWQLMFGPNWQSLPTPTSLGALAFPGDIGWSQRRFKKIKWRQKSLYNV